MAKSPFSDDIDTSFTDPDNLVTGSGSQMFSNERLKSTNKKAQNIETERARQGSQLLPIANDLLDKIRRMKEDKENIGPYLTDIYAKKGRPEIREKDVEIEFRARQMSLNDLRELEAWITNKLRQTK